MSKKIAIVVFVHLIGWGLAWLAGYDFNVRGELVAGWELILLVIGLGIAFSEELSV